MSAAGTDWTCNNADPLHCTYADPLAPGASSSVLTVNVRIDIAFRGNQVINTAFAEALVDDKGTPDPSDDVVAKALDPETTPVLIGADLQIVKTGNNETPLAGSTFEWILVVTNLGPDTADNVVVIDDVPNRVIVISVSSSDFACTHAGNKVTCTRSSMVTGASGKITIVVLVPADLPAQSIENVGIVKSSTPDPDLTNNSDADTVLTTRVEVAPPIPTIPDVIPPLPVTGTDSDLLVELALAFLGAGVVLVLAVRRRRRPIEV